MAKRPSIQEILEAARRGGAVTPGAGNAPAAAPELEPEASAEPVEASAAVAAPAAPAADVPTPQKLGRPLTVAEKLAAARAKAAPASAAQAPVARPAAAPAVADGGAEGAPVPVKTVPPPAAPLGRPMTLAEKMAAARAGAAPASAAPAPVARPAAAPAVADEGAEGSPAPVKTVPPPAAPLGRPMTLAEKMAAARAGASAGGGAGAGVAKPAAARPAVVAAKPVAVKRELPPLAEITDPKDLAEALRQAGDKKSKEAAAAKAAAAPATPVKPAKEKEVRPSSVLPRPTKGSAQGAVSLPRRAFLSTTAMIWIGWGSFVFGVVQFSAMMGRFMFPNVLAEPPSTIKIGLPSNYEPSSVNERFKAEWGFWVVRSDRYSGEDIIYAIQSVCTHLGCPPNWLAGEQKFKCPCHGSGFYISGVNFEGPAPRPLERFKISTADDGQLVVDKSQKFQEELGQWSDPDSYTKPV